MRLLSYSNEGEQQESKKGQPLFMSIQNMKFQDCSMPRSKEVGGLKRVTEGWIEG